MHRTEEDALSATLQQGNCRGSTTDQSSAGPRAQTAPEPWAGSFGLSHAAPATGTSEVSSTEDKRAAVSGGARTAETDVEFAQLRRKAAVRPGRKEKSTTLNQAAGRMAAGRAHYRKNKETRTCAAANMGTAAAAGEEDSKRTDARTRSPLGRVVDMVGPRERHPAAVAAAAVLVVLLRVCV